jgi:hypothetical protein
MQAARRAVAAAAPRLAAAVGRRGDALAPPTAAGVSALLPGTGRPASMKRRLASSFSGGGGGSGGGSGAGSRWSGGGGGRQGRLGGGGGGRDDDHDDDEFEEGPPNEGPEVLQARAAKLEAATRHVWDERVPFDFAALERDEAAWAAAPPEEWSDEEEKAARREAPPTPQSRVSSLESDPYEWPLSMRLPKEAPLWMLYQAERQEVPLRAPARDTSGVAATSIAGA